MAPPLSLTSLLIRQPILPCSKDDVEAVAEVAVVRAVLTWAPRAEVQIQDKHPFS